MDISILIPVFNGEDYILDCLQSIEEQDFSEYQYEVIIVNDGSSDRTKEIVENYCAKNPNIKLHNQNNMGNAFTRNKLFELAIGQYVYCLDVDDFLVPNSLNEVLKIALSKKLDILSFASKQTIYRKNETASNVQLFEYSSNVTSSNGIYALANNGLRDVTPWWYIVRREFLDVNNIRYKDLNFGDIVFTYNIFIKAKSVMDLPWQVHWYYQSPNSMMRSSTDIRKKKHYVSKNNLLMAFELNQLIFNLGNTPNEIKVKDRLVKRRDYDVFFNLFIYSQLEKDFDCLKNMVHRLRHQGIYPVNSYNTIDKLPKPLESLLNVLCRYQTFIFLINRVFAIKRSLVDSKS